MVRSSPAPLKFMREKGQVRLLYYSTTFKGRMSSSFERQKQRSNFAHSSHFCFEGLVQLNGLFLVHESMPKYNKKAYWEQWGGLFLDSIYFHSVLPTFLRHIFPRCISPMSIHDFESIYPTNRFVRRAFLNGEIGPVHHRF